MDCHLYRRKNFGMLLCMALSAVVLYSCLLKPESSTVDRVKKAIFINATEETASHESGTKANIYILGSINVGQNPYEFPSAVLRQYNSADVVVFETNLFESDNTVFADFLTVAKDSSLTGNTVNEDNNVYNTLKGYIDAYAVSEKKYSAKSSFYDTYMKTTIDTYHEGLLENDYPLKDVPLAQSEPWVANLSFYVQGFTQISKYSSEYSVNGYFFDKAKRDGKTREYLESPESAYRALSDTDIDEQTIDLIDLVENVVGLDNEVEDNLGNLVQMYIEGDTDSLKESLKTQKKAMDSSFKEIYTDRNKEWIVNLKDIISKRSDGNKNTFFVVVPVGHLITLDVNDEDTYSFQKLLGENGFTVTSGATY